MCVFWCRVAGILTGRGQPVVRLEGKVCVFPGIPRLFQRMLDGLVPFLLLPPPSERPCRQQIFTKCVPAPLRYQSIVSHHVCHGLCMSRIPSRCSLPESSIAPYLTTLQARVKDAGVRVGSYPLLAKGVYVSLIGRDQERIQALGEEVAQEIQGRLVSEEEARREKAAL